MSETITYRCSECKCVYEWRARCPECGGHGTMEPWPPWRGDAIAESEPAGRSRKLSTLKAKKRPRVITGDPGMDLVLGDEKERGFARPSVVLFGGGQGAGKSSLSLQAIVGMNPKLKILMLLNEETPDRLVARAERLGFRQSALDHIQVHYSQFLAEYRVAIAEEEPDVVVVDSLSMLTDPENDTNDEQANRMRYAEFFYHDSEDNNRIYLLISHLNKENEISGIRKIQYLLDAIMTITKVGKKHCVLECPEKNRFGEPGVQVFYSIGRGGLEQVEREEAEAADESKRKRAKADDVVF